MVIGRDMAETCQIILTKLSKIVIIFPHVWFKKWF